MIPIICDVCDEVITDVSYHVYARGRVQIHNQCKHKLLQWIWDEEDTDKYLSAIHTDGDRHNLTIKNFITDSDEHIAMIKNTNYYLFIDNTNTGPYICVCNEFFNTVPTIVKGMNGHTEEIMAVFNRGSFFQVVTKITVMLVDEYGHAIKQKGD